MLRGEPQLQALSAAELIELCISAQANDEDGERYAVELESRLGLNLSGGEIIDGINCITREFDEIYRYSGDQFYSYEKPGKMNRAQAEKQAEEERAVDELLAELDARKAAAEAKRIDEEWQKREQVRIEKAQRSRDYAAAVKRICKIEYYKDRFRALTTPMCTQVFLDSGIP
ncbi:hypothetical protein OIHEL45_15484 [Sulfitobacter indolifex HEL-45]|uniref:Uncharacterized protein n=1 Tax=Sulfitobacter indolifex HEL-45 TaxID=391624 RepID=A0ABM9X4J0_9RHOB|nr:hypothetical protein OIHEL45_15484 [Sulfitobacter indolifex HEL-45]